MGAAELGQRDERAVPVAAGLVRVDHVGGRDLAGGIHHRDLHPGPEPRIEAESRPGTGGGGKQQVAKVSGKDAHGPGLGHLFQASAQVGVEGGFQLGAPGPAHGLHQETVPRPAVIADAEGAGDAEFLPGGHALLGHVAGGVGDVEVEDVLLLAPVQGQDAVRGQARERFGEVEIVGELLAGRFLALLDAGGHSAALPDRVAQGAHQFRVFAEPLDQDGARALQRGLDIGDALARIDEAGGSLFRRAFGMGEQGLRQGAEPGLAGGLRLGAALHLERQVEVFEPCLCVGGEDARLQGRVELPLAVDALEDGGAARLQVAQIGEALLQIAELGIVEAAGDLLAVARDERHRRPAIKEFDGGSDLPLGDLELRRDGCSDGGHGILARVKGPRCLQAGPESGQTGGVIRRI